MKNKTYSNLDKKNICDDKTFCKVVKPMLLKKIKSNKKLTLIEINGIIKTGIETSKVLNVFFFLILSFGQSFGSRHLALREWFYLFSCKSFQKEEILKELNNLNINKAKQNCDISANIIKWNSDIFGNFVFTNLNCCINTSLYSLLL